MNEGEGNAETGNKIRIEMKEWERRERRELGKGNESGIRVGE